MAPAKTGSLVIKRIAVSRTDHKNKGKRSIPNRKVEREHIIVVIKLILPKIEEIPAK